VVAEEIRRLAETSGESARTISRTLKSVIERIEGQPVLTEKDTYEIAWGLMSEKQQAQFEEYHERDIGLTIEGVCRLRINIYQERGNVGLVMRIIPLKIKTVEELELPPVLNQIADERQQFGLVQRLQSRLHAGPGRPDRGTARGFAAGQSVHRQADVDWPGGG
jgi:hypothetical protein